MYACCVLFIYPRYHRTRFEAPLEPLQMLTWLLLLVIVGGFYSFVVPGLPTAMSIAAGAAYAVLASSAVFAGIVACWKDPIDPNVRRFHQVCHTMRRSRPT